MALSSVFFPFLTVVLALKKKTHLKKKTPPPSFYQTLFEFVFLVLVFFLVSLLCSVERKREKE